MWERADGREMKFEEYRNGEGLKKDVIKK